MRKRILTLIKKEFRQFFRDKRSLGLLLFLPFFLLLIFGYAISLDVKNIPMGVLDEDKSPESRKLIDAFINSGYFQFIKELNNQKEIDGYMGNEVFKVAFVIPGNFSNKLLRSEKTSFLVIVDGTNSSAAQTIVAYVNAVSQSYSSQLDMQAVSHKKTMPINFNPRVWYNPELISSRNLVPGLIVFIMMLTASISTSLSIVREKERGTIEQLQVSPVKPLELILGKTIPYIFVTLFNTLCILVASYFLFDISIKGSWIELFFMTLIFLSGSLGMGLLISTVAQSQQYAFLMCVLIAMLPSFILSGYVFPINNMPFFMQVITYIIPARYFLSIIRGIILKGASVIDYWPDIIGLSLFTISMIGLSILRIQKQNKELA